MGVSKGCILCPTLHNIFLNHPIKEIKEVDQVIERNDQISLELIYTDDTMLILFVFDRFKNSTRELEDATKEWGLKINGSKCKLLSECNRSIEVDGLPIEHVQMFKYLETIVPNIHTDIKYNISLAVKAFGRWMQNIWLRRICKHLKMRLHEALILPIAVYGCEIWSKEI